MTNKYMYFIANWKMFGSLNSLKSLDKFIKFFKNFKKNTYSKIIYCPPTTLINPMIKKLRIITLDKNLINKLIEFLNLEKRDDYKNKIINFSLNKNFIKALLSVPDYRLAKHKERDFFLYNRLVKTYKDYSPSTPWVLNENHLNRIFEKTEKANLKLLNLLNSETKSSIMNNSEWWDLSAFSNKVASDPYLNDYSLDKDLVSLIYQLFESNKKGIDFIASKALQKEFFNYF